MNVKQLFITLAFCSLLSSVTSAQVLTVNAGDQFTIASGTTTSVIEVFNDGEVIVEAIGPATLDNFGQTTLDFISGIGTLSGSGEVVLTDRFDSVIDVNGNGLQTVTNAADHTIRGTGTINVGSSDTFNNLGTIDIGDGQTIAFSGVGNVSNFGTINLGDGATALLSGLNLNNSTVNAGNQLTIDNGTTNVIGTLFNNGQLILPGVGSPTIDDGGATILDFGGGVANLSGSGEVVLTDRFDSVIDVNGNGLQTVTNACLLYTSPSPRD